MKPLEPRVSKATPSSVARLARFKPGPEKVLSIYFDLDPDSFALPGPRESQMHSLLSEAGQLIDELEQVFLIEDEKQEKDLLDRLHEEFGRKALAAAGLGPVLEAVVAARVETLLVEDGFEAEGFACLKCDWIGLSGMTCPVDGGELESGINVADRAIELTYSKSGDVHIVRYHPDLRELGSIAALLRF